MRIDYKHPLGRYVELIDARTGEALERRDIRSGDEATGKIVRLARNAAGELRLEPDPARAGAERLVEVTEIRPFRFELCAEASEGARDFFHRLRGAEQQQR